MVTIQVNIKLTLLICINIMKTSKHPMTRQQIAETLGISTKTLSRFLKKENIVIEARTLIRPSNAYLIIQKYMGY